MFTECCVHWHGSHCDFVSEAKVRGSFIPSTTSLDVSFTKFARKFAESENLSPLLRFGRQSFRLCNANDFIKNGEK